MTLSLLVTIALTTFGSLAWIVLLASVSALHDALTEYSGLNIADQLGLVWWIVWYQFLLLVTIAVLAALGALKEGATVLGNLLAAALALQAYFAQEASILVRYWKDFEQSTNGPAKHLSKAEAVLAGVIMMAISTTLLIVWLGSSETILELLGRGKKMQDRTPSPGPTPGVQYYANGGEPSRNGSFNGGAMIPPPPIGVHPKGDSSPPLPQPAARTPQGSSPGAHPLARVDVSPGENAYPQYS